MRKDEKTKIYELKKHLRRYKKQMLVIRRLENKLANIDDKIYKIKTVSYSDEPKGGRPVTITDLLSDKIELGERINHLVQKARQLRSETLSEIDMLDDPRYAEVMEQYYIECKTFEDIADSTGYTLRHIMRLQSEALKSMSLKWHNDDIT